ncbi:MAG: hypothetical protein JJT76_06450 [Clostridiaceae bacterium]|nr:hypothetical protein [Clostridiaceae bacterium]
MSTMSKKEAIAKGLPTYNEGCHKLIDVSDNSTLILQLPNSVYVTIASIGVKGKDWAGLVLISKFKAKQKIKG